MRIVKQNDLRCSLVGVTLPDKLELSKSEIQTLKRANEILSIADDLSKRVDGSRDFGVAEIYINQILEDYENKNRNTL